MSRRSIEVDGLAHGTNPVPAASRIGPLLATGAVRGVDTATGRLPDDVRDEVRLAFDNLVRVVRAGGATPEQIVHVNVFVGADGIRDHVNARWGELFADPAARPARHLTRHDLPGGMRVQLEALAFVDGSNGFAGARETAIEADRRLADVDACAASDALDALGLSGVALGVSRFTTGRPVRGRAITVRLVPASEAGPAPGEPRRHLCTAAIESARGGEVLVIDNGGRTDVAAWGGTLAAAAVEAGVAGVVIDGAFRDRDECEELGLPVFARAAVPVTARGRIVEQAWNVDVEIGGVRVCPGDQVIADGSGVVVVASAHVDGVADRAAAIVAKERRMAADVRRGVPVSQVMGGSYETMLGGAR